MDVNISDSTWIGSDLNSINIAQEFNVGNEVNITIDGNTLVGTMDTELITIPNAGHLQQPWFGIVTETDPGNCLQEKLDEFCKNFGIVDDVIVQGEIDECEDSKFARQNGGVWGCYDTVAETEASECVDNKGELVTCLQSVGQSCTVEGDVDSSLSQIIKDTKEYGCHRYDKIEFSSPKETLIRCVDGYKPRVRKNSRKIRKKNRKNLKKFREKIEIFSNSVSANMVLESTVEM